MTAFSRCEQCGKTSNWENCEDPFCEFINPNLVKMMTAKPPWNQKITRNDRDRVIRELENIYKEIWGERCRSHEAGCVACAVWATFDAAANMTDSSFLETEQREYPNE